MFYRPLLLALPVLMTACASTIDPHEIKPHVAPLKGSPIVDVSTDYTDALQCVARHADQQNYPPPRIAVGHISDLTGADDALTGRRLTQGATLMAISAITNAGMRVVERYDLGVVQVELDYASNGLLRDAPGVLRKPKAGQVEGADLYIVGGITEYNPNIRSSGKHGYVGGNDDPGGAISVGKNEYIVDVGIDLRIIDARSTEVLGVRAFRKQIRGQEIEAGVFSFFGGTVVDIGGGQRALEPVQTAVRSMIDRSVFEFLQDLYGLQPGKCNTTQSPYGTAQKASYTPAPAPTPQPAPQPAPVAQTTNNRQILSSPSQTYSYNNTYASSAPSVPTPSPTPGVLARGNYFIELEGFPTYSSAVATLAYVKNQLPVLENWSNRVVETYSPYRKTEFALQIMENANQASANETCQRIQAIGYVCRVRSTTRAPQTAHYKQSGTLHR